MIVAVDFDGTCVTHEYPEVGKNVGAAEVLQKLVKAGHKIILWTVRSDLNLNGDLWAAIEWFRQNDIPLMAVNSNPTQESWSGSPKVFAHLYIDDAALGCPLIASDPRPHVDWHEIDKWLMKNNWYEGDLKHGCMERK